MYKIIRVLVGWVSLFFLKNNVTLHLSYLAGLRFFAVAKKLTQPTIKIRILLNFYSYESF